MYLAYFDESGDDGFPNYTTQLFVLVSVSMHHLQWKGNFKRMQRFRRWLKDNHDLPVRTEFHTRQFILGKRPYVGMFSDAQRREILTYYFRMISALDLEIVTVAIDKRNIPAARQKYDVLEHAFSYNIQRIENTISAKESNPRFMIITDEGRIYKMKSIARQIQRVNFIPSRFSPGVYRREIEKLVEDPIPMKSTNSPFIQIADAVAFLMYLYVGKRVSSPAIPWSNRISRVLEHDDDLMLLDLIENRLNLKASRRKFGLVYYPKPGSIR